MNLFPNPTYNGYFKKGGTTCKPIAGTCVLTAYNKPLSQAKLTLDNLMQGSPVLLKNTSLGSNNEGLSANVLSASAYSDSASAAPIINGFIVNSPNDILLDGDTFPRFLKNQVVGVAKLGSNAPVYLPAEANLADCPIDTPLKWNSTAKQLSKTKGVNLPGVRIAAQPVLGVIPEYDSTENRAKSKDGLVILVNL